MSNLFLVELTSCFNPDSKLGHLFFSTNGWNYLEFRLWVGTWTGVALLILVAFDLSALVRYITRFTEESFAALISLIFIVESIVKLFNIASDYPINLNPEVPLNYNCSCDLTNVTLSPNISVESIGKTNCTKFNGTLIGGGCDTPIYYADVFFFSVLLFLFTFSLAYFLKMSRNAPVFPTWVSLQSSLLSGLFFSVFVCPHKCGFALLSLRHNGPSEIVLSCYQGLHASPLSL